jgi:hypothetical protein
VVPAGICNTQGGASRGNPLEKIQAHQALRRTALETPARARRIEELDCRECSEVTLDACSMGVSHELLFTRRRVYRVPSCLEGG